MSIQDNKLRLGRTVLGASLAGVFALVLATGCLGPRRGPGRERMITPQPTLVNDATWFSGTLASHTVLAAASIPGEGGAPSGSESAAPSGRHSGGSGGMGPMGGGGGPRGGGGGGMGGPPPAMESSGGRGAPAMMGAMGRETLRISFANRSKETIELSVRDIFTPIGNFAPRPERLALAPGQSAELEPMMANGSENYETMEVTLRIKLLSGVEETQILALKLAPPNATPAPGGPSRP